jgi:hypothetical protein
MLPLDSINHPGPTLSCACATDRSTTRLHANASPARTSSRRLVSRVQHAVPTSPARLGSICFSFSCWPDSTHQLNNSALSFQNVPNQLYARSSKPNPICFLSVWPLPIKVRRNRSNLHVPHQNRSQSDLRSGRHAWAQDCSPALPRARPHALATRAIPGRIDRLLPPVAL